VSDSESGASAVAAGSRRAPRRGGPRIYLLAAAGLVVIAVAAVAFAVQTNPRRIAGTVNTASLPVGPAAPALRAKGWLNSAPLMAADLAGKVVLYDFWTYSCVNCVRTIPYVRSWYDRYAKDGLVVIGIHSPEFDFEKNHDNVQRAVSQLHVTWPVALDDDMTIWNEFSNQYWPAKYVADRQGHVRYFHPGEGEYDTAENVIRTLLGVPAGAPRATAPGTTASGPTDSSQTITPETYLGADRGTAGAVSGPDTYPDPGTPPGDTARLAGAWVGRAEEVEAAAPGAAIVLRYHAREVNLVMAAAGSAPGGVDVSITLDGKPLPAADRTAQTMTDALGTFVHVKAADLYRLVLGPSVEDHTLRLTARAPGLQAFAFTFGT
jgi:thiol-disulfide isomerase/thioredoxin